jgi:hypothetical protein
VFLLCVMKALDQGSFPGLISYNQGCPLLGPLPSTLGSLLSHFTLFYLNKLSCFTHKKFIITTRGNKCHLSHIILCGVCRTITDVKKIKKEIKNCSNALRVYVLKDLDFLREIFYFKKNTSTYFISLCKVHLFHFPQDYK